MIAALGAALLGVGLDVVKYAVSHPDIAAKLMRDAGAAVGVGGAAKTPHPDAVAAQVAGIAAARAVAAQEFGRMIARAKNP